MENSKEYRSVKPENVPTRAEKETKLRWLEAQSAVLTKSQQKELADLKRELNIPE
jgi:hypothetical protein